MNTPVAVIGIAARLPDAKNAKALWENIASGKDSVGDGRFPDSRRNDIRHVLPAYDHVLCDREKPFFTGSWFDRVDSGSNPVDGLSRKNFSGMWQWRTIYFPAHIKRMSSSCL